MSSPHSGDPIAAAGSVLRYQCLFEALRLNLLPRHLAASVASLAARAEDGSPVSQQAHEVRSTFLDCRDELGLSGLEWTESREADATSAVAALAGSTGDGTPREAADRLGRACEGVLERAGRRKARGAYYTPGWVADAICETVVQGVLRRRGVDGSAALSLSILDPAAGAGAFMIAAVEAIAQAAGEGPAENTARRLAARECLFGAEMERLAAQTCRLGVWLAASRPGRLAYVPASQVAVRDGLRDPPEASAFDAVVGNPPWGVRLGGRRAAMLARRAPEALSGHRDSFLFFLQTAAASARDDGAVGMLLPDALLWQVRYEGMRRALLQRFRPLRVCLLGDRIFPGATAPACTLCLVGRGIAPGRYVTSDLRRVRRSELWDAIQRDGWAIESGAPLSAPHCSFVVPPGWLQDLATRMGSKHPTLGDLAHVFEFHDVGINYARARAGREILYEGDLQDQRDIPVTRGRDFGALTSVGSSAWLRHDWLERVRPGDRVAVRERIYRRAPKLLLRQTGDRPVATADWEGVWFGRSVIAATAPSEEHLLWLAAVLNSDMFAALYRAAAPEGGRPFAQVKVSKLKVIPVPAPDRIEHLSALAKALCGTCDAVRREELMGAIDRRVTAAYGVEPDEMERVKNVVGGGRGEAAVRARPGGREDTS